MNETKFNRASWGVLLFAPALLATIFTVNVYRYGLPTDGWVYVDGSGFFKNILGLPSALQPNDILVALDGEPFETTPCVRKILTI